MKTAAWLLAGILALAAIPAAPSRAQAPVIRVFPGDGTLAWTNPAAIDGIGRLEWASRPGGPWHSFTHQPLHTVDARSTVIAVASSAHETPMRGAMLFLSIAKFCELRLT